MTLWCDFCFQCRDLFFKFMFLVLSQISSALFFFLQGLQLRIVTQLSHEDYIINYCWEAYFPVWPNYKTSSDLLCSSPDQRIAFSYLCVCRSQFHSLQCCSLLGTALLAGAIFVWFVYGYRNKKVKIVS